MFHNKHLYLVLAYDHIQWRKCYCNKIVSDHLIYKVVSKQMGKYISGKIKQGGDDFEIDYGHLPSFCTCPQPGTSDNYERICLNK